ncbi:MAG TPA: hypothetical protein VGJ05_05430 [Fimbriiglobus sp.]|jgi:hypothetical protein
MAFDLPKIERFAMQLETMSAAENRTGMNIKIRDIGAALGLDEDESFRTARLLADSGWVKFNDKESYIRLTIDGHKQLEKLKRPRWVKWVKRHPISVYASVTILTGIVYSVITFFIVRSFSP